MAFIHEDFLLGNKPARRLYHKFAETEPIFDYHCHISPKDIAENRQFKNLFEIWLEGDHYKWRAMRSNGVAEKFVTGNATPEEKFNAWAKTVPHTLRNPLYHWTHLELKRYFGISDLLSEKTAAKIWKQANAKLATPALTTQGILKKFKVKVVCTTDDPADNLEHHRAFATTNHPTKMLPAFRPDKALTVNSARRFQQMGGTACRRSGHGHQQLERVHQCAGKTARVFSFAELPSVRPRLEPMLRGFLFGGNGRWRFSTRRAKARPFRRWNIRSSPRS